MKIGKIKIVVMLIILGISCVEYAMDPASLAKIDEMRRYKCPVAGCDFFADESSARAHGEIPHGPGKFFTPRLVYASQCSDPTKSQFLSIPVGLSDVTKDSYYEFLGTARDADDEEVEAAFFSLCLNDDGCEKGSLKKATCEYRACCNRTIIKDAYRTLINPKERAAYDKCLSCHSGINDYEKSFYDEYKKSREIDKNKLRMALKIN